MIYLNNLFNFSFCKIDPTTIKLKSADTYLRTNISGNPDNDWPVMGNSRFYLCQIRIQKGVSYRIISSFSPVALSAGYREIVPIKMKIFIQR